MLESLDVLSVGNAILDMSAAVPTGFPATVGLVRGTMSLVDAGRSAAIAAAVPRVDWTSAFGGSAANTAAGVAALGGEAAFAGKIADDPDGWQFLGGLVSEGRVLVRASGRSAVEGVTATCRVLLEPDGERTMATHLGASALLCEDDVDEDMAAGAAVTLAEAYLLDSPTASCALRKALGIAASNGRTGAITLSDSLCVERHRDAILALLRNGSVGLVFANEGEAKALYGTGDLDAAVAALRVDAPLAVVTLGPRGALAVAGGGTWSVPSDPVETVADLTGAGDAFAAGFIASLARGGGVYGSLRLGSLAAASVVARRGPRIDPLASAEARRRGLLGHL